jgi:poly(beta-D-mannuronate) lyase
MKTKNPRLANALLPARQTFWLALILLILTAGCTTQKSAVSETKEFVSWSSKAIKYTTWESFSTAVKNAKPGDIIQLKNGTYSGNLTVSNSGTKGNPIIIIPEKRGEVIITGNSSWKIDGHFITIDGFHFKDGKSTNPITFSQTSSHSKLLNSAITNWNLGGQETKLVSVLGTFNEVGYCYIRGKNTSGMMLEVVRPTPDRNDHRIHHVYFGYFKDPGGGNGFETVRVGTSGHSLSSSYTTLENCVFERCDGESEIISSKSGHNVFRNNTFLNSDGALTFRHGHDGLAEGNHFINTLDRKSSRCNGIRIIGERQVVRNNHFVNLPINAQALQVEYGNTVPHKLTFYDQVKDALIENNSFENCDKSVFIGASKNPKMDPPKVMAPYGIFRNNLISSTKGSNASIEIEEEVLEKKLFTYANNLVTGKIKTIPAIQSLPEGINVKESTGKNTGSTVGVQVKESKPSFATDIAPDWIKERIRSKDPDFVNLIW